MMSRWGLADGRELTWPLLQETEPGLKKIAVLV